MALNPLLEDILVKAPTEAAAFAAGLAIHPTLAPLLQDLANVTWSATPTKPLDAAAAAEVAAELYDTYDDMETEASFTGYDAARFKHLWDVTLTAPGLGTLIEMLRRDSEVGIDFTHGLRKAKLEAQWDDALRNLRDVRIPGPDLAYMVVRGVVPDGGTLPSALPTRSDALALPPQLSLDTLTEASKTGWDAERFAALVARSGLAMAPVMAAQANFRGILSDNDYLLTIARGDLFPAYADPVKEVARAIPTTHEGVEGRLRGWLTDAEMYAQTARHGMTQADTDLLFKVMGRPLSFHQVFIGERRGGVYDGPTTDIDPAFLKSLRESNVRPEWYNLAWAQRYAYPTAFVLRSLTESGDLTEAEAHQILLYEGWEPTLAEKVAAKWATPATAKADPWVAKAQNQAWTAVHKVYDKSGAADAETQVKLTTIGVPQDVQARILELWKL